MTGKLGGSMLESEISADVADFMRKLRNVWFAWWVWVAAGLGKVRS